MSELHLTEEWRAVVGYEGYYEVSDCGRVKSVTRTARVVCKGTESVRVVKSRFMVEHTDKNGRIRVSLSRNRKTIGHSVNRLVLEAFVGPCPQGMQSCHFPDRNTRNNRLDNLRWGTAKDNAADRDAHGTTNRGENRPSAKLTNSAVISIRKLVGDGISRGSIAKKYGVSKNLIRLVVNRKIWRHV